MSPQNRKHKILLVIRHPVGGIKTYLKYVYKEKYFSDFDFTIVMPASGEAEQLLEQEINNRVTFIGCENDTLSLLKSLFFIMKDSDFSLVHSHGFTSGACTSMLARLNGLPHLMTSHDVMLDKQFSGVKGNVKNC